MITHNTFVVLVLIPKRDWTFGEIKDIDIKTRKILTLTRNLHPNSDINCLYMQKRFGERGWKQVQSSYENRIIAIRQHLPKNLHRNTALEYWRITEQELPTKYIRNKRDRDSGKTPTCNNKCRLYHTAIEDVTHVICNCPEMSARYYLPLRHDRMGKILYVSHIQKHSPETKVEKIQEPEYIRRVKHMEYWWNISIKTATKIPHNKPDLTIWNHQKGVCTVVDFSFPLNSNITKKVAEKKNNYGQLIRNT